MEHSPHINDVRLVSTLARGAHRLICLANHGSAPGSAGEFADEGRLTRNIRFDFAQREIYTTKNDRDNNPLHAERSLSLHQLAFEQPINFVS
jgi:hypothetical protein